MNAQQMPQGADSGDMHELSAQVSAVLAADGRDVGPEVTELLQPLLRGDQDFVQNREMLQAMIAALEA